MPHEPEQPYLTVDDVAKRFGVNVTTVYRLVQRGRLPAFKIGNQWRFSQTRLEEWVADRERIG
jgi:excisionase family DNA binding protein